MSGDGQMPWPPSMPHNNYLVPDRQRAQNQRLLNGPAPRSCSCSVGVALLIPTIILMVTLTGVTWGLLYLEATRSVEELAGTIQTFFVTAARADIGARLDAIQRVHDMNAFVWANTSCDASVAADGSNATSFDAFDDVRATLWRSLETIERIEAHQADIIVSVGFPNGAALGVPSAASANGFGAPNRLLPLQPPYRAPFNNSAPLAVGGGGHTTTPEPSFGRLYKTLQYKIR